MHSWFDEWYHQNESQILSDFFTFLRFKSISTDIQYKSDVRETANWLEEYLKNLGFDVTLWETEGHPVIFASHIKRDDLPTLLIYHHYDVQPVDPLELWESDPFDPQIRGENVYARGASDNKGQCFYTLTALKAWRDQGRALKFNLKIVIEGEEECGSQSLSSLVKLKTQELKADYLLIVDMGIPGPEIPAITLGLRGITTLEIQCKNSHIDLHSGVHGGVVLNPNRALVQALAALWDLEGHIAIPHFYDTVKTPIPEELSQIDHAYSEEEARKNFGIRAFQKEKGWAHWEANTLRPNIEINGISGGYTGPGFKTVIPSVAIAKISCRLVPDQDPHHVAEMIGDFICSKIDPQMKVTYHIDHGGKAIRTSPNTSIAKLAIQAYEEVFQRPCKKIFSGATIPIVKELQEASGSEVAMIGVALDQDDFHAPNEHFSLSRFKKGAQVMSALITQLAPYSCLKAERNI